MRYTITDNYDNEVTLERSAEWVNLSTLNNEVSMSVEQFKEFRRAVGYVWTEIEGSDK